ncbi:Disease resistance protein RGA2 [Camellia lanceoleosa]|uniref:Disease resistance protein RGA2 n=1 Tax=Camellia lanceoleosa TaxID=1840588 RepID=A0ACC0IUS0_9ERIC|nr:Disease resistance protein RGA2 [Camellia lanceoleosa]
MVDKLSSYLINFVSIVDVGTGIQNLKKALEDLETLLADAENKQVYDKDIKKWLEVVQPLAYDADDLLDDFATEALERKIMAEETTMGRRPAKFPCLSSIFPFNLKNGSKLNEITSQLQEVATKGKDLEQEWSPTLSRKGVSPPTSLHLKSGGSEWTTWVNF